MNPAHEMEGVPMTLRIMLLSLAACCLFRLERASGEPANGQVAESKAPFSELEGVLKIHPKFMWKYYITGLAQGQSCALFGDEKLKDVNPGSTIHVQGRLGTRYHPGGNEKNPSPFGPAWYIYMEVESVKVLRGPVKEQVRPAPGDLPPTTRPLPRKNAK